MAGLTLPFLLDSLQGIIVLKSMNKTIKAQENRETLIENNTEAQAELLGKGWKQNLFYEKGFLNKQICSVVVIAATYYFSVMEIIEARNKGFAVIVLTYSLLSLGSFLDLSLVRDF